MRTRRHPNERLLVLAGLGLASALAVLALSSAGVYLGRFLQWNSWDLLVRPGQRLAEVAPGLNQAAVLARASAVTILLTALFAMTYLAFYALLGVKLDPERRRSG